ncbi:MAG: hypothetical protein ACQCXQ_12000 [Verrucomicrobiales bacterium]
METTTPEVVPEPTPAPAPEPTLETPPPATPAKASDAAEAVLQAFLQAPDWASRSAYVLQPETMREAMESYSHQEDDGPTAFESVSIVNSYTDKDTGNTLFIYKVVTKQHPEGFPAAVAETNGGWLVDWPTFVEFRDDHFAKFAEGPADQTGRFHLIVSAPPAVRAEKTQNQYFVSYLLDPPLPDRQHIAYVRKDSTIQATLAASTQAGAVFAPVLELTKRSTPDGRTYLEITEILATDWLPRKL